MKRTTKDPAVRLAIVAAFAALLTAVAAAPAAPMAPPANHTIVVSTLGLVLIVVIATILLVK
jgi:hypothetical protein